MGYNQITPIDYKYVNRFITKLPDNVFPMIHTIKWKDLSFVKEAPASTEAFVYAITLWKRFRVNGQLFMADFPSSTQDVIRSYISQLSLSDLSVLSYKFKFHIYSTMPWNNGLLDKIAKLSAYDFVRLFTVTGNNKLINYRLKYTDLEKAKNILKLDIICVCFKTGEMMEN